MKFCNPFPLILLRLSSVVGELPFYICHSSLAGEEYVCLVCERAFLNIKQLERHQLKKRHWG